MFANDVLTDLPFDVCEWFSGRNVVDDDDPVGSSVVGWSDGTEALLAGCVPNLKLHPDNN